MIDYRTFRNMIARLLGDGLPKEVDPSDYNPGFEDSWKQNPARTFLRLSSADQSKVYESLKQPVRL